MPGSPDAVPGRLIFIDGGAASNAGLAGCGAQRRCLIVLDRGASSNAGLAGCRLIDLDGRVASNTRLAECGAQRRKVVVLSAARFLFSTAGLPSNAGVG